MSRELFAIRGLQAHVDDVRAVACTCQRAISLASSHFSSAIICLNSREPMTLVRSPTISGRLLSSASTSSIPE